MEAVLAQYWQQILALIGFTAFLYTIKGDTKEVRSDLKAHAEASAIGFANVNGRLDKVNGRLNSTEERAQKLGERVARLEP